MSGTAEAKKTPATAKPIVAFTIERDGFLPGQLPAYRVLTVKVEGTKAKVEYSMQKYLLGEALALVEDKAREALKV